MSADFLIPGTVLGYFRIDGMIGRGGMGEVYAATDTHLRRPVALKVIKAEFACDPHYKERFLREMRIVAGLKHPNIAAVFEASSSRDGRLYMVMERISGRQLRELLVERPRLEVALALHCAIQIAGALETAHRAGLVHRDVKPENVMMGDDGKACLIDFGIAKDANAPGLTRHGDVMGSYRYLAPEAATRPLDRRADIYALAVLLYEMLSGRYPYPVLDDPGARDTDIQAAHLYLEAIPLPALMPGCPPALWAVLAACLAKDPGARLQSAGEFAEALHAVLRDSAPPEHPATKLAAREFAAGQREHAFGAGAQAKATAPRFGMTTEPLRPGVGTPSPASAASTQRRGAGANGTEKMAAFPEMVPVREGSSALSLLARTAPLGAAPAAAARLGNGLGVTEPMNDELSRIMQARKGAATGGGTGGLAVTEPMNDRLTAIMDQRRAAAAAAVAAADGARVSVAALAGAAAPAGKWSPVRSAVVVACIVIVIASAAAVIAAASGVVRQHVRAERAPGGAEATASR